MTPRALYEGIFILEETTPNNIEMFHHRIKAITQNNFCIDSSDLVFDLKGDK